MVAVLALSQTAGRGVIEPGDDFAEDFLWIGRGKVEDGAANWFWFVAAIRRCGPAKVDADVAVFEFVDPGAGGEAVPGDDAPGALDVDCGLRIVTA